MPRAPTSPDVDPQETTEWLDSLESVLRVHGVERAHHIVEQLIDHARRSGVDLPYSANTAYVNTIPPTLEPIYPGDPAIEKRLEAYLRWNAMAMVVQANRKSSEYGGHIASYASCATLYEVGFNHFWRARSKDHPGDLVLFQGHASPGIYARAYLEGRLSADRLRGFRREVELQGLPSYPHPWLMPDFWQVPTVSMGLGPLMSIYAARFQRYLENRDIVPASDRKIWTFLGDGEMDEPESLGAITMPVRERLDNLIFVINCNLQRLDGPVRGNGSIVQELEAAFRGAGWNVLKVLWGSGWDRLFAKDDRGLLRKRMSECVDGEYQSFKAKGGAYTREHFFGKYAETRAMVANMSDDEISGLERGGHDARKVYAAYRAATDHKGGPTVILAKTVKGYGLGSSGESSMSTHQQKKLDRNALVAFRDRFKIPVHDDEIDELPFHGPDEASAEARYLRDRRAALGGALPTRHNDAPALEVPELDAFAAILDGSGGREISTTMAFVRILNVLLRDKKLAKHIVPIVPDEARTFGMEGLFRQIGIYASAGQLYKPEDLDSLMFYREDIKGQILEEGINEAGAMCSWIAAGTSYANHGVQMVPFYIFYSMFGFQRVGDLAWAGADMQARGFLIGATAGRTTLAGEGLQHQDGHSHITAGTIPTYVSYDPTFGYELAVIIQDGLRRMYRDAENVAYYITCMNENYQHPALPAGSEDGILRGMYRLREGQGDGPRVQLMGAGTILREHLAAAEILERDHAIAADVWSMTSYNELRRDGLDTDRWNRLHPEATPRTCHVERSLTGVEGPFIAATDYIKLLPDSIRQWIPGRYDVLGTDGFGRSDARAQLRKHFEVDAASIVVAALHALAQEGKVEATVVTRAIESLGIDPEKVPPILS